MGFIFFKPTIALFGVLGALLFGVRQPQAEMIEIREIRQEAQRVEAPAGEAAAHAEPDKAAPDEEVEVLEE